MAWGQGSTGGPGPSRFNSEPAEHHLLTRLSGFPSQLSLGRPTLDQQPLARQSAPARRFTFNDVVRMAEERQLKALRGQVSSG